MSVLGPAARRLTAATATVVFAAVALLPPGPATAATNGYVRLAHLSPDTPAVDVYLRAKEGTAKERVFPGVEYGALSDYLRLAAGTYTVAMRKAGAPSTEAPVLTTEVALGDGQAYTVAGVGRYADLGLKVIQDDLSLPPSGQAKVRIVQASVQAPVLDVAVRGGAGIADDVAFADTTDYRQVEPGRWTVRVQPAGGTNASDLPCTLAAGSVYSLLILDAKAGLKAQLHRDAGRQGVVPTGGLATGAGGLAPSPWPVAGLLATGAAILAAAVLVGRRRAAGR